jgi:hypothetical protein
MFKTGVRVSRDFVTNGVTFERLGNVVVTKPLSRVAYVVFDNHTDSEPTLCTFESLRVVETTETKKSPGFLAAEKFAELVEAQKKHNRGHSIGSSVAALRSAEFDNPTTSLVYGRVTLLTYDGGNSRVHLLTEDGTTWSVPMPNVVAL